MTSTTTKTRTRYRHPESPADKPDLVDQVIEYLASIEPGLRDRLEEIEEDLRAQFSGLNWWVSSKPHLERRRRAQEILSLFNGRNASEVGRRLGVSRATVYRVLKQPRLSALPPASRPADETVSAASGIETAERPDSDNGLLDRGPSGA